jgi:hypothetical protein
MCQERPHVTSCLQHACTLQRVSEFDKACAWCREQQRRTQQQAAAAGRHTTDVRYIGYMHMTAISRCILLAACLCSVFIDATIMDAWWHTAHGSQGEHAAALPADL